MTGQNIAPEPPFRLTPTEKSSGCWVRLSAHLTDMLAELREQNDQLLTEQQTGALRGRIAQLKAVISIADEEVFLPSDDNV